MNTPVRPYGDGFDGAMIIITGGYMNPPPTALDSVYHCNSFQDCLYDTQTLARLLLLQYVIRILATRED
jgi:hypothetical protein